MQPEKQKDRQERIMALKRLITRMTRIGSSRGFGIQSPNDYRFVCDIVNCRYPYYAYADLRKLMPCISGRDRRKAELVFRITNFIQPDAVVNLGMKPLFETYAKSACKAATVYRTATDAGKENHPHATTLYNNVKDKKQLLLLVACGDMQRAGGTDGIGKYMSEGTYLIADGINDSRAAREAWEQISTQTPCTLVFDLYDMGIVAVDSKREKTSYKINY